MPPCRTATDGYTFRIHAYLSRIIRGAQTLAGMLDGTMSHDVGYEFLRIGRNLERADMTTRIIDVRSADLLAQADTDLRPFENIQWMSVLKSLTAYQMYRRTMQVRVRRSDALRFLLQDQAFPRAFYHCVVAAETGIAGLPRPERAARVTAHLKRQAQLARQQSKGQYQIELAWRSATGEVQVIGQLRCSARSGECRMR